MLISKTTFVSFLAGIATLAGTLQAQTPLGTAITYQGQLRQSNQAFTGTAEVSFDLYNTPTGGTPMASIAASSVGVTNGLFTKLLDFWPAYDGNNKWVEIKVRTGLGAFTTLSPRQQLTAVPYALNSRALYGPISTFLSQQTDATNQTYVLFKDGAGANIGYIGDGSTGDNNLHLGVYTGDIHFITGGAGRPLALTNGGNIGMGTLAPTARLHVVRGTSDDAMTIQGTANGAANFAYLSLRDGAGARTGYIGDASAGDADVMLASDAGNVVLISGGNRTLTARSNGYVGIGRATPITNSDFFSINAIAGSDSYGGMYVNSTNAGSRPFYGYATNGVVRAFSYVHGLSGTWHLLNGGTDRISVLSTGNVGINTTAPAFTLEVNGTAGKPGGGAWSTSSDERVKKNIASLKGSLETLLQLRGVTFEYKDPEKIHELHGTRVGFVAQEVEGVIPDWVSTGDDGFKKLTVRGFEAMAVEALRDLRNEKDAQIGRLEAQVRALNESKDALSSRLEALERKLQASADAR